MKERPILFSGPMVRAKRGSNDERRVVLDDEIVSSMHRSGMTAKEIAAKYQCSTYPIKAALKRLGLSRPAKRRPGMAVGQNNPAWTGGRRIRPDGYVAVWTLNGECLEHRVVMEKHLGRRLSASEVVHHIDRNKQNNHIENLEVMSQSDHAKLHAPEMHAARYGN